MPHTGLLHPEPPPRGRPLMTHTSTGETQTQFWLSLWDLWVLPGIRFIWALPRVSGGYGVYSKCDFNSPPPTMGYLFLVGSNILLSMLVQLWVVILEFLQEKMSSCPSTLPSCRLFPLAKPKRTGEGEGWNEGYCRGPAPADPGYSKRGRCWWGSGYNSFN